MEMQVTDRDVVEVTGGGVMGVEAEVPCVCVCAMRRYTRAREMPGSVHAS